MRHLPWPARLFVGAVICGGYTVLATYLPTTIPHPLLFALVAAASAVASGLKLRLPLGTTGASNLSVSYTIDFFSLLLLGPAPTMLVAALSAWAQSTTKTARQNPAYRTLFNIAALIVTVYAAGVAFTILGGQVEVLTVGVIRALVAAALVYYLLNTFIVATAVGLSTSQPVWRVWQSNFLWTAPSYFVGAGAAAAAAAAWTAGYGWLIPLAAAPVYLTFRSYRIYLERITAEQRHREEMHRLHTQTVEALRAARDSEQRYALSASGSNDGLWDWDLGIDAFYVSERWKLMIGFPPDYRIEHMDEWFRHVHPEDVTALRSALQRHLAGETTHFEHEYRMCHFDGTYRWMLCRGVAVRDESGCPVRMAGSQTDMTERRRIQDELSHAALHDSLTGLANRSLFTELLERALVKTRRSPTYGFAVLFVDLDRFKLINDSLGHQIGDRFLVAIGKRIYQHLRPGDSLARLGGDEFAVLLEGIRDSQAATTIADRLQTSLLEPFDIDGHEIYASASIGIAFGDSRHRDSDDLLRDADIAMYRAKALGRSQCQTFDPSMHALAVRRLTLETELRRALEREEFEVHYQPIVELETHQVCGFEALVRWVRPDGNVTYPSEFIKVAEETRLIIPLTDWVLQQACAQVAGWQRVFKRPLTLTINISSKLFDRPTLVDEVRHAIGASGLLPGTLRLEITESFLLNSSDAVAQRLDDLRSIPVELYLDDFGTGFSSLSYLHRYRLDALKIDQSFISRIGGLHNDAPIVGSIVNLARQLGMGVIAEGVETAQQAQHLLALDCPHAQGYLFSRPLTAAEARDYLASLPPPARKVPPPPPQLTPRRHSRGEVHATMPRRIM
jgi:diguanylate cyclase (GGDEF)-like protein/PAS domain S-box-containing protein